MKMGEFHCENSLEVYGEWEKLKAFYNNNWGNNGLSLKKVGDYDEADIIDYERGIYESKMDMIYYIFLTREIPPLEWLDRISKMYKDLEFNLMYQNKEIGVSGDMVFRNGEVYYKEEESL